MLISSKPLTTTGSSHQGVFCIQDNPEVRQSDDHQYIKRIFRSDYFLVDRGERAATQYPPPCPPASLSRCPRPILTQCLDAAQPSA